MNPELAPLCAIVCGYEKSGTTLINEILRRHPQLDSGFEVGVLLADSPAEFRRIQPYYRFFRDTWKLEQDDLAYLSNSVSWAEFYARARERSPVIENKQSLIFDKTPIYMRDLSLVLEKVPGLPCLVNVRDPRALMLSWARWSGPTDDPAGRVRERLDDYLERFRSYAEGYRAALPEYGERILLNQFERLCLDPEPAFRRIFEFFGFEFNPAFLQFSSEHFVYGNTVSRDYLTPYENVLPAGLSRDILQATREFSQWHFQPG